MGNQNQTDAAPWLLIALAAAVIIVAVIFLLRARRNRAEAPLSLLGFAYDAVQNIFYSVINAWQRVFGYCQFFDCMAPFACMIIDCEPIRFTYNDEHWLIELWKGQYCALSGMEVGIYKATGPYIHIPGLMDFTLYDNTDAMLYSSSLLYKNGKQLFERHDTHWWLTGFKLAEFSQPDELEADISIRLESEAMQRAFSAAMAKLGYAYPDYHATGTDVSIRFKKPRSRQVITRNRLVRFLVQRYNRALCALLQQILTTLPEGANPLEYITEQNPALAKKLARPFLTRGRRISATRAQ